MNDENLTVHIPVGIDSWFDGGPFDNAIVTDVRDDGAELYVEPQQNDEADGRWLDVEDIETDISDEVNSGQPVRVSGAYPEDAAARLSLPASDLYEVFTHDDISHPLKGPESVRMIQRYIDQYGADYQPLRG